MFTLKVKVLVIFVLFISIASSLKLHENHMTLFNVSTSDQIQKIMDENDGVAVIAFFASWNGPSRWIRPIAQQKSQTTGIPLIVVDIDNSEELSHHFNIRSIPVFVVVKGTWDNVLKTTIGSTPSTVNLIFSSAVQNK